MDELQDNVRQIVDFDCGSSPAECLEAADYAIDAANQAIAAKNALNVNLGKKVDKEEGKGLIKSTVSSKLDVNGNGVLLAIGGLCASGNITAQENISCEGDISCEGSVEDGNGNVLSEKANLSIIGNIASLTTTAKNTIVAAINEVVSTIGSLGSLTTTAKNTVVGAINEIVANIGALSSLSTTAKTNIVGAVNEVVTNIGNMSELTTTAKSTIVAAINEACTKSVITDGSITKAKLSSDVRSSLSKADNSVQYNNFTPVETFIHTVTEDKVVLDETKKDQIIIRCINTSDESRNITIIQSWKDGFEGSMVLHGGVWKIFWKPFQIDSNTTFRDIVEHVDEYAYPISYKTTE